MVTPVDRDAVQQLAGDGAQLVDVLPRAEYDDEHLPHAIHLPLTELSATTAAQLDPGQPVIVYCFDSL